MSGGNVWGGSLEISSTAPLTDAGEYDRASYRPPSEAEVKQGWLLRPDKESEKKKKRNINMNYRSILTTLLAVVVLVGLVTIVVWVATRRRHRHRAPDADNYTIALHQALMFFNAQRCMFSLLLYPSRA